MDIKVDIPKLAFFVLFLVLNPKIECQMWMPPMPPSPPLQPPPLCMSQFVLANHACSRLPFTPVSPPSPPTPPSPIRPSSPGSPPSPGHRHRHRHRHQATSQTPVEQECCRWLQEIDSQCVCDLLVHLPVFLAKPIHKYTVMVDASCNVTYMCSGRLISA